jgi:hypothetical protein
MHQFQALKIVEDEVKSATTKFGRFASTHEGYAIIKEELDELWDAIKNKEATGQEIATEARQVAAMAVRFLVDLCP